MKSNAWIQIVNTIGSVAPTALRRAFLHRAFSLRVSLCFATALCLTLPAAAQITGQNQATDDIVFVRRSEGTVALLSERLLVNDGGGLIDAETSATRGNLVADPNGFWPSYFLYTPSPDFWQEGMDSFRYTRVAGDGATVFLIADQAETPAFFDDFDDGGLEAHWQTQVDPGGNLQRLAKGPGDFVLAVDLEPGVDAYVGTGNIGPNGGSNTSQVVLCLDPNGAEPSNDVGFIPAWGVDHPASDGQDETVWSLSLREKQEAYEIRGECQLSDGSSAFTEWVPLGNQNYVVVFDWWAASGPDSPDGGMALRVDGELVTGASGLRNHGLLVDELFFGARDVGAPASGSLHYDNITVYTDFESPLYEPLYSASFETTDFSDWDSAVSAAINQVQVTSAAAASGGWGMEVILGGAPQSVFVAVQEAQGERHLRTRFRVRLPQGFAMVDGEEMVLLRGLPESGTGGLIGEYLEVRLRRKAGAWSAVSRAVELGGFARSTSATALAAGAWVTVEVEWWAAEAGPDGGLRLWLDGVLAGEVLGLNNAGQRLGDLRWGALEPPAGASGTYHLDDFEIWR